MQAVDHRRTKEQINATKNVTKEMNRYSKVISEPSIRPFISAGIREKRRVEQVMEEEIDCNRW